MSKGKVVWHAWKGVKITKALREQWARDLISKYPEGCYSASGDSLVVAWPDGVGGFLVYDCVVRRSGYVDG